MNRQIIFVLGLAMLMAGCDSTQTTTSAESSSEVSVERAAINRSVVKIDQEIQGGKIVAVRDLHSTTSGEGLVLSVPPQLIMTAAGLPIANSGTDPIMIKIPASSIITDKVTSTSYAKTSLDDAVITDSTVTIGNRVGGTSIESTSTVLLSISGKTAAGERFSALQVPTKFVHSSAQEAHATAGTAGTVLKLKSFTNGDWRDVFVPIVPK